MEVTANIARELATLRNEQNRSAIEHFNLGKKKITEPPRDTYTKSSQCEYLNYTKKEITKIDIVVFKGKLPREFVNLINGDGESPIILAKHGDNLFEYNGVFFTRESIPEIPEEEFEEIRAVDNVVDFGKSNYCKYNLNGKEYRMYSSKGGCIRSVTTEHFFEDDYDLNFQRFTTFWDWCMGDVSTMGVSPLGFKRAQIEGYLKEMGIDLEPNFVTVKMGEKENTVFYSKSKWHNGLLNKDRYDEQYEYMQTSGFGKNFGAGAVINIGGTDYVFDANCQIKIPYGADIFDVKYPPVLRNLQYKA